MTQIARLHAVPTHRIIDPEPLWREVLGQRLRELRRRRGETLTETAERAGISPQYLSEVERGLKDPSSEVLAAVAGALGATVIDVTSQVTGDLGSSPAATTPQAHGQALLLAA